MTHYVGLDVSQKVTAIYIFDDSGRIDVSVRRRHIATRWRQRGDSQDWARLVREGPRPCRTASSIAACACLSAGGGTFSASSVGEARCTPPPRPEPGAAARSPAGSCRRSGQHGQRLAERGPIHRCRRAHPLAPLAWPDPTGALPDPGHTSHPQSEGEGRNRVGQIGSEAGEGPDRTADVRIRSRRSHHRSCVGADVSLSVKCEIPHAGPLISVKHETRRFPGSATARH